MAGLPEMYDPPAFFNWCKNATYYVRLANEMTEQGKSIKRAVCLRNSMYICEPKGNVERAVRLQHVSEIYEQELEVKRTVVSKSIERHVLFKIPADGIDVLLSLTHFKENGPDGNNDEKLVQTVLRIAKVAFNHDIKVTRLESDGPRIETFANWVKSDTYIDTKTLIEAKLKERDERNRGSVNVGSPIDPTPSKNDVGYGPATGAAPSPPTTLDPSTASFAPAVSPSTAALVPSDTPSTDVAALNEKVKTLQNQLAQEKACRDDMVRDMRADFDTMFIRKQAEEFEVRQRAHDREMSRYQARIKELEGRLDEPKTYSGAPEHVDRIKQLEQRVATLDAQCDEHLCRANYYEEAVDDQYKELRRCYEFIQDGALPRIRDLQSGKDPKQLKLLPQVPPPPKTVPPFSYDPNNKSAPRPAATGGGGGGGPPAALLPDLTDIDFDLDDLPAPPTNSAAPIDLDLDDDLDLDLPPNPAQKPAPIDLDDDLL
ncbi:hypothetical protein DIPPA_29483 [Diplonema papillatum]|nr:hypothetical protein DIPPA_29483 [Diplonema papillatum]